MRKLLIVISSLIIVCNLNSADLNIKSNSKIFNNQLIEINNMKKSIELSGGGRAGAELNKLFHWETLPNAFSEVIKADDAEGFKSMLELIDKLNIDINSFGGDENSIFNIATQIIDNNATNCMKLLVNTNFDFNNPVLDKNYKKYTILNYAINKGASKEIINILEQIK